MIVGVPKEVKDHEARVGLLPSGATALVEAGHRVLVQSNAGWGSSLTDQEYQEAGAEIVPTAAEVWAGSDLVVKVKEPQPSEYPLLRPGLVLFTYLHLAPLPGITGKPAGSPSERRGVRDHSGRRIFAAPADPDE